MVHCVAIISINRRSKSFMDTSQQTQSLVGIITVARFAILAYCYLPPFCNSLKEAERFTRFRRIHENCMVSGTSSPLNTLMQWLRYGQSINYTTQKEPDFVWLDGMKTLCHDGINISLDVIPDMAISLMTATEVNIERQLCFGWSALKVDFGDLQDNKCNTAIGYSFLDHPANLQSHKPSSQHLLKHASRQYGSNWICDKKSGQLNRNRCLEYLERFDALQDALLILCYICCGQPPRRKELLSCTLTNHMLRQRSLYIHGRKIALVTRYHKGQAKTGLEMEIPRFMPQRLTQVFLVYLYFIRPFAILCQSHAKVTEYLRSPLIWPTKEGKLVVNDGSRLTSAMKSLTRRYGKMEFSPQRYRQIAIKINMDIIRIPSDLLHEGDESSNEDEMHSEEHFHIAQSAHTRRTEHLHYGVSASTPFEILKTQWVQYEVVSTKWQSFLGFSYSPAPATVSIASFIIQRLGLTSYKCAKQVQDVNVSPALKVRL